MNEGELVWTIARNHRKTPLGPCLTMGTQAEKLHGEGLSLNPGRPIAYEITTRIAGDPTFHGNS